MPDDPKAEGTPETPPQEPPKTPEPPAQPPETPPPAGDPPAEPKKEDKDLGDPGKEALSRERQARKEAEKRAKDTQARLDSLEAEKLSDTEKIQKQAEKDRKAAEESARLADTATGKLRRANLTTALGDHGLTGGRAKAAARLLERVEFDEDTDEPTNLDDAIKTAKAEYGEEMFKATKPTAPDINGGGGGGDKDRVPDLTAEELAMAKSFDMTPAEYAAAKDPGYQPEPVKT